MRVITIVSLGASAVLGLAALVVAKTVLPNMGGAASAANARSVGVPVVVAAKPLKFGDKLTADHLKVVRLPADAVPAGAFSTVPAVLSQDRGGPPVTLSPIAQHEPLLPAKLSGPGARPSVAAGVGEGMRAYTIRVNDVSGVGGHALPGDRVDVVLTRDLTPDGPQRSFVSTLLVQNVRVLAVDLNADQASNKPATPATATLEVGVEDSQKLASAGDLGKLSLALRRTGSTELAEVAPLTAPVAKPVAAVAPARPTVRRVSAPRSESAGLIVIVEGDGSGESSRARRAPPPPAPAPAPAASAS
jgi:pilus assembly protein CpaB